VGRSRRRTEIPSRSVRYSYATGRGCAGAFLRLMLLIGLGGNFCSRVELIHPTHSLGAGLNALAYVGAA